MSHLQSPKPRLLVVDDERVILWWVKAALMRDFEVLTTTSPVEALVLLAEKEPDVLLTDLQMDEMEGVELLEIVHDRFPNVATLVLTGTAGKEEAIAVFKHGAYDLLEKPCHPDVLRQAAARALRCVISDRLNRRLLEELRHANDKLRDREGQLGAVVDGASDGIIAVDERGEILSLNRAAQWMFECSVDMAVGKNLAAFIAAANGNWSDRFTPGILVLRSCHRTGHTFEGVARRAGGEECPVEISLGASTDGDHRHFSVIVRDITTRKAAEEEHQRLFTAVEQARDTIVITDRNGTIQYVNPAFVKTTGYEREEVIGANPRILKSGRQDAEFYRKMWETISRGDVWTGSFFNRRKDGVTIEEEARISPIRDYAGAITNYVCVKNEVTQRRALESQLRQSQKLEAIGQLAAGIAHEINTPTQFIGDNVRFLDDAFGDLLKVMEKIRPLVDSATAGLVTTEQAEAAAAAIERADLEYLCEEVPTAIQQSLEGVKRVMEIVRAMKEFSHPGGAEMKTIDLNRAIESTATVSRNEWKYVAVLETDLDPNLPPVSCLPGELNQVFLNMIVNAAHAIADAIAADPTTQQGKITISTRQIGEEVEVRITDTGAGMPETIRSRIFDPFFTTKEVGKGTGQGLSIAHNVITKKHGGKINVESEVGEGTTFILTLPLGTKEPVPEEVLA